MSIFLDLRISRLVLFIVLLSGMTSALAGLLETKNGEKSIEGVKLASEVSVQSEEKAIVLKPYASGLRKKKVALFWAKVYVGQVFAPEGLAVPPPSIEEAHSTLSKQPLVALRMTFLRDVGAGRQKSAFEDSLETNGIDPKSESVKGLFAMVEKAGDAKENRSTTLVFERRKDGTERAYLENGMGELQSSSFEKGTIAKILSIWFGKPADSGMERLQRQFLGKADE